MILLLFSSFYPFTTTMGTCYAIVRGESAENYHVLAVFNNAKLAEEALPKYGKDQYGEDAYIEEFPFDPEIPDPPAGMTGFRCWQCSDGSVTAFCVTMSEMAEWASKIPLGEAQVAPGGKRRHVYVWACNEDHAIKIAAENFARQKGD